MMQTFIRSSQRLLLLIALFSLSACGFHLKHHDGLATKYPKIFLQSTVNTDLTRLIKTRLRGTGVEIVQTYSKGATTLKVNAERRSSRTISVNVTAQNAETELGFNLSYSIQPPGYEALHFSVNLFRDFTESSSEALAKSRESELITHELRTLTANHIINTMLNLDITHGVKLAPSSH